MKYLGKTFLYESIGEFGKRVRRAKIVSVEFHPQLGPLFTAISPFGNTFRVTKREILKLVD